MTVLKIFDKKELAERKAKAELEFQGRINGVNAAAADELRYYRSGVASSKGAIKAVMCNSVYAILPNFVEKIAQGYTLHETLGLAPISPIAFEFYMVRPEADIKKDLAVLFKEIEATYVSELDAYNASILQREVDAQVQREIRQEQKQLAEAEQARRDRITEEVRQALGAK